MISTVLLTGAGGAAAVSVWKSLNTRCTLHMADMDDCAAGLYMVPPEQRLLLPRGDAPEFVDVLLAACMDRRVELLIPTVDAELLPVALARARFEAAGIQVAVAQAEVLRVLRDKSHLIERATGVVPVPWSCVWSAPPSHALPAFPLFAKPRAGSGSRDLMRLDDAQELSAVPCDGRFVVQEWLGGEEYSVDVYVSRAGKILAAVPRIRMKTDSGIAVTARTVHARDVIDQAVRLVAALGLTLVANVQFRRDGQGVAKLLEINARYPGTLPLTAAAGVDIPDLMLRDFSGEPLPEAMLPFEDTMVVRYWTEQAVPGGEWQALAALRAGEK